MEELLKQTLVIAIIVIAVVGGGLALYYVTKPSSNISSTESIEGNAAGYQIGYTPQGIWADYLGYIPVGYNLAPHEPNAPTWPCPSGMSASACKVFQASCGNGVCDPNESCSTCPIDCGPTGAATCDPYTGRTGAPVSVCFLGGLK